MRFENFPFSPQLIQARWVLGKLPSEEVPQLAQSALGLDYDGKNIRRIAGLTEPNSGDLQPLMSGFFAKIGVHTKLSTEEAGLLLARFIAEARTVPQHPIPGRRHTTDSRRAPAAPPVRPYPTTG